MYYLSHDLVKLLMRLMFTKVRVSVYVVLVKLLMRLMFTKVRVSVYVVLVT